MLNLAAANDQLVAHVTGHSVRLTQMERRVADAAASEAAARTMADQHAAQVASMRTALSEQSALLGRQAFQVRRTAARRLRLLGALPGAWFHELGPSSQGDGGGGGGASSG